MGMLAKGGFSAEQTVTRSENQLFFYLRSRSKTVCGMSQFWGVLSFTRFPRGRLPTLSREQAKLSSRMPPFLLPDVQRLSLLPSRPAQTAVPGMHGGRDVSAPTSSSEVSGLWRKLALRPRAATLFVC